MKIHTTSLTSDELSKEVEKIKNENLLSYPTAFQMGRNFLKQGWLSAVAAAKGQPLLTTPEKAAARLAVCEACDFFDKNQGRCTKCGCFMRAKANLEVATCPASFWGNLQDNANLPIKLELPDGATPIKDRTVTVPSVQNVSDVKTIIMQSLKGLSSEDLEYFSKKYDEAAAPDATNRTFKIKNLSFTIKPIVLQSQTSGSIQVSGSIP